MSEQYTPTEAEARDGYVTGMIRDGDGSDWDEYREGAAADFDRFIAQVRRDAQGEALRSARIDMGDWADEITVVLGDPSDEDTWAETSIGEWLDRRAERIESEAS